MNERLKELILSLGIHPEDEHYDVAVAVIRACADVADDNFDKGFCPVGGFILDHFGISYKR